MRCFAMVSGTVLLGHLLLPAGVVAQQRVTRPIIDVHLHAMDAGALRSFGPNPVTRSLPPASLEENVRRTVEQMRRHNVVLGVIGGTVVEVDRFLAAAPERFYGSATLAVPDVGPDVLRARHAAGKLEALGEVLAQYEGLSPSDSVYEPYWALAEQLDIPVGVHTGMSFPGITDQKPTFRVALGNPLLLEGMLNRHPRLRVYIMHGGHPFLAETIGILSVYPRVYVDVAVINWIIPRDEFHAWLRALIRAGLADRIMFGSDQMVWPEAIGLAIAGIESATFLTERQKDDIFYGNAARFFRLSPEVVKRHRAR